MTTQKQNFENYNISSIPYEIRRKQYRAYEMFPLLFNDQPPTKLSEINKYIIRDDLDVCKLNKQQPNPQKAIQKLKDIYSLDDSQFISYTEHSHETIIAIIPNIEFNTILVDNEFISKNYIISNTKTQTDEFGEWFITKYKINISVMTIEDAFNSFEISSIDLETRNEWSKSYKETDVFLTELAISAYDEYENMQNFHECSLFTLPLITSSCREAVENLVDVYHLSDEQFWIETLNDNISRVYNSPLIYRDRILAVIPNIDTNIIIIDREMSRYGFKRTHTKNQEDSLRDWFIAIYSPDKLTDITTFIKMKRFYLWFYTPAFNYGNIIENGLIPSTDRYYNKDERRLHFYITDGTLEPTILFESMLQSVSIRTKQEIPDFDFKFNKYIIMADKLPDNITFKLDPNMTDSVFTTSTIPIDYISNIEETYIYPPSN